MMVTRELGDPFRRDALALPTRHLAKYAATARAPFLTPPATMTTTVRRSRALAMIALAALAGLAGAQDYPEQADPLHRSVSARRRHRRHRADPPGAARRRAGPADHHREPRRRGRQRRHRHRRESAGRRLHDALHAVVAHDQSEALRQAALRRRARLRADQPRGAGAADPGRAIRACPRTTSRS